MPPPPSSSITTTILPPPGPSALSLPPTLLTTLTDPNTYPPPKNTTPFISALRIRIPVFVTEQQCSLDAEIDADDARSWHWIAFDGERPVATLRLVPITTTTTIKAEEKGVVVMEKERVDFGGAEEEDGEKRVTEPYHCATKIWDGREPYVKIGRMATLKGYRGQGVAKRLIEESLAWAKMHAVELSSQGGEEAGDGPRWKGLVLSHAQKSVQGWWGKMGFEVDVGLGVWWEEGIEHVGMWRRVEAVS